MAELVDRPVFEALHIFFGEEFGPAKTCHAQRRADDAKITQRFEGAERIAVEFAFIINAAHPRTLDEIVGQDFIPQRDHFLRFRKKAVAADVEAEALMFDGPADPADIDGVFLDNRDTKPLFRKQISGCQPSRARADDCHVDCLATTAAHNLCPRINPVEPECVATA